MQDFLNKKIILGICGGIAAYKSAFLVRELTRLGAIVRVVMTDSAEEFITPLTLQALSGEDVRHSLFDLNAERAMGHIELARWADLVLIAPASANFLAKMAHGLADDLLSTLYLVTDAPVIVCPAMNKNMWAHPATQANCELLSKRSVVIVGPAEGSQACGEVGFGRMSEVDEIITALRLLEVNQLLKGRDILITAGPTRESIDPVRYISNHSSGKMGYALASAAVMAGARVTLISGPTSQKIPEGVTFLRVDSASDMFDAVLDHLKPGMIFIGTAAVADYYVKEISTDKLKKQGQDTLNLTLSKSPDVIAAVAASKKAQYVVGFAAETSDLLVHARDKLESKKLDMIIANQVGKGVGFDSDLNQVTVITKDKKISFDTMHKTRLAGSLISMLALQFL